MKDEVIINTDSKQYIIFDIDEEEYGISIEEIESIGRIQSITRVPKTVDYIKGVINVRGDIIPVMSIRKKLNFNDDIYTNSTRIIIIRNEESSIALIVDKVKEVVNLDVKSIESLQETSTKIALSFVKGIGKINDRIVTIINISKLIQNIDEEINGISG